MTAAAQKSPMSADTARQVYAMGFVPAREAGHDPYEALEIIRADNAAKREARAALNVGTLFVGKAVNDGKIGWIEEIDGHRVTLRGILKRRRSVHVGELNDWSFRTEATA